MVSEREAPVGAQPAGRRRLLVELTIIAAGFAADRLAKWWAAAFLAEHGAVRFNRFLAIHETYNEGIAFGLLQGVGPLIGWLSLAVVAGLLVYMIRLPRALWLARLGLALLIGGAAGNLLDRIVDGRVLDFIVTPFRPGIFNIADLLINVGMGLIIISAIWQRAPAEAPETAAAEVERPLAEEPEPAP